MMTEQQMRKMQGGLIEFQDGFNELSDSEAQWVIQNTVAAVAVMVAAVKKVVTEMNRLLEFLGTLTIPVTITRFVAKEKFVVDTSDEAPVKISYLGDNFTAWFGSKTEEPIGEQTLCYAKLLKPSVDGPIIAELGGEAKAETTLTEIYALLANQAKSEKGALLNNGWWNIFYVRDVNGVLRAVSVHWRDGGWGVNVYSVEYSLRWPGGLQVFFRN